MHNIRLPEEILGQIYAGEFDGRLYKMITNLTRDELRLIVTLVQTPTNFRRIEGH